MKSKLIRAISLIFAAVFMLTAIPFSVLPSTADEAVPPAAGACVSHNWVYEYPKGVRKCSNCQIEEKYTSLPFNVDIEPVLDNGSISHKIRVYDPEEQITILRWAEGSCSTYSDVKTLTGGRVFIKRNGTEDSIIDDNGYIYTDINRNSGIFSLCAMLINNTTSAVVQVDINKLTVHWGIYVSNSEFVGIRGEGETENYTYKEYAKILYLSSNEVAGKTTVTTSSDAEYSLEEYGSFSAATTLAENYSGDDKTNTLAPWYAGAQETFPSTHSSKRCESYSGDDYYNSNKVNKGYNLYARSITEIITDTANPIQPFNLKAWFARMNFLKRVELGGIDTRYTSDMSYLFFLCGGITDIDISGFNTRNVNDMSDMFHNCGKLVRINFGSGFNTSNVTDMSYMFDNCYELKYNYSTIDGKSVSDYTLDLSFFDTSNVTDMSYMFGGCNSVKTINTSSFSTGKVTNFDSLFHACYSVESVDVSGFDTSSATNVSYFFHNCNMLKTVNGYRSSENYIDFDTQNVGLDGQTHDSAVNSHCCMNRMFNGCCELKNLRFGKQFVIGEAICNLDEMFNACVSLTSLIAETKFNINSVSSFQLFARGCASIGSISGLFADGVIPEKLKKKTEAYRHALNYYMESERYSDGGQMNVSGVTESFYTDYACDITVTLDALNGCENVSAKFNSKALTAESDYSIAGNRLTVKAAFLATRKASDSIGIPILVTIDNETYVIPIHGKKPMIESATHSWVSIDSSNPCLKKYICQNTSSARCNCGAEYCEYAHSFSVISDGGDGTVYTCANCGESYTVVNNTATLGHTMGEWIERVSPDCVETGLEYRVCTGCGIEETRIIPALGHDYAAVITAPTCTETGFTTYTCSRCGDSYTGSETSALGHNMGEWTLTAHATCTDTGVKSRFCTVCNDYTESESIAALGHSYVETINADKTSTYVCALCLDSYVTGADSARYYADDAVGNAGNTVSINISLVNNPGIISLRSMITYDMSVLELVSITDTGLLDGYNTPSATVASPYTLRWSDALAEANNTSNGTFVTLTFRIKDGTAAGNYEVIVSNTEARDINGAAVQFSGTSVLVSVVAPTKGNVNGDGEVNDWDEIVLSRYLAGWDVEIVSANSDIDGDGEITDWDAILLGRYLTGWDITV